MKKSPKKGLYSGSYYVKFADETWDEAVDAYAGGTGAPSIEDAFDEANLETEWGVDFVIFDNKLNVVAKGTTQGS